MNPLLEMFEHTTDAVFGTDKNGRIGFWNKSCEKLLGISQKNAIGQRCTDLICGSDMMGNKYCSDKCQISKFHDKNSPNNNLDLVINSKSGEPIVVNIGSYYTNIPGEEERSGICVFHSMRSINCHQLLMRLSNNPETSSTENTKISSLSKREAEILRLISTGKNTKTIATQLSISHATVRNHIKNIYTKLEVHSRAEAINCAMRHSLV